MLKFVDKVKLILESNSSWHDSAAHSANSCFFFSNWPVTSRWHSLFHKDAKYIIAIKKFAFMTRCSSWVLWRY